MDMVSLSPVPVGSVRWQQHTGTTVLTVHAKATFELVPGTCVLAAQQERLHEADVYVEGDANRSLRAPCDVVPGKPRADVVLVGSAFAPKGVATPSLTARLQVAELEKAVEVFADRHFDSAGELVEGTRFAQMPLDYERAAGGPDTSNPVGIGHEARDSYGRRRLPNLQPAGLFVAEPDTWLEPIGFGPIAPRWPARHSRVARFGASWSAEKWAAVALPEGFDHCFFNVAPPDQQLASLREDEAIVLENLHRTEPRLVTRLPGVLPVAFLVGRANPTPIAMRPDTLWIDTDRAICAVTYRGQLQLERADESGRILIGLQVRGSTLTFSDLERAAAPPPAPASRTGTMALNMADLLGQGAPGPSGAQAGSLPFKPSPSLRPTPSRERPQGDDGALPFAGRAAASGHAAAAVGALDSATAPQSGPGPSSTGGGWSGADAPSILPVSPPSSVDPAAASPAASPWSVRPARPDAAGVASPASPRPIVPPLARAMSPVVAPPIGAGAAAALGAEPTAPPRVEVAPPAPLRVERPASVSKIFQLLWYAPDSVARMRRARAWRPLLEELEQRPTDPDLDDPGLADDAMSMEDRREVFEIVSRAPTHGPDGVGRALRAAVRDDGKFVPQLVLVSGELRFAFDELESLKATITTAEPLLDEEEPDEVDELRVAVRRAKEFLKNPDLLSPPGVSRDLVARIRVAFAASEREQPETYLEDQTDRVLLEKRHYQKRIVFGETYLRGLWLWESDAEPVPVYLPEELTKKLPLFQRFEVRLIAEAHLREDQYETSSAALKAVAIARVMPAPGRD